MQVERQVAAPPNAVWAVITDLDHAPTRMSGIDAVERLDGADGFDRGTRWRETRTMFGRTASEELEITAIEPGRSYTVEANSAGTRYRSVVGVEQTSEQSTRLWMTFEAQPAGPVAKMLAATVGKLFQRPTRKALQTDLDDIATAVEQRL